jgi:hypothetical protein
LVTYELRFETFLKAHLVSEIPRRTEKKKVETRERIENDYFGK